MARPIPGNTLMKSKFVAALACAFAVCSSGHAQATKPDALLQIDMNRSAVIERIVEGWKGEIPAAQLTSFRNKLNALRADQLLVANLSGSFDGVLEVLSASDSASGSRLRSAQPSQVSDTAKAVGDINQDLVYTPVAPCRVFDTRTPNTPFVSNGLGSGVMQTFDMDGTNLSAQGGSATGCNIPTAARAVVLAFSPITPPTTGWVIGAANDGTALPASTLFNYSAALTLTTFTVVMPMLGQAGGDIRLEARGVAAYSMHGVGDVTGYFMPPNRSGDGLRVSTPNREPYFGMPTSTVNVVNGVASNFVSEGVRGATIAGGGYAVSNPAEDYSNIVMGDFGTIGGGSKNLVVSRYGTITGGNYNRVSGQYAAIGGGELNSAGENAAIGGGSGNFAAKPYSAILGGYRNSVRGDFGVIGGGNSNSNEDRHSVISGGTENYILGVGSTRYYANSILGGERNFLEDGIGSTIAGGRFNTTYGEGQFVAGGAFNSALGRFSFSAGRGARSINPGSFIWADSNGDELLHAHFASSATDQFAVRSRGGVAFRVAATDNADTGAGCSLPAGGAASWVCSSDRNLKESIQSISPQNVLSKVLALPVTSWQFIGTNRRHIGPMAQDFRLAFGLGADDKNITTSDVSGVALAAIQGLNEKLEIEKAKSKAKDAKISKLEADLAAIKRKLGI
jgi:Chaperone of endosialidase